MEDNIHVYKVLIPTEITIDFEKLYKCVLTEYPKVDMYSLIEIFGDNIHYYLRKALNITIDPDNDDITELIWEDFGNYVEEHKK